MAKNDYPHYISTNPTGEDLLEGKSQEKISKAIAEHILYVDGLPDDDKLSLKMPRVIGLEGEWGSGKSNVLSHLQHHDLVSRQEYKFFIYDAWANQEDLQRRTILEQLTAYLIEDRRLLKDNVSVRMLKPDDNNEFHFVDEEVSWKEKLDLLMAKRVKNIAHSISPLNTEFKLLMLTLTITPILIALMNTIKFNKIAGWWYFGVSLFVALLPTLISVSYIKYKKLDFKKAFRAYNSKNENKTTHQVVNEAEPTIHEFSSWMNEISKGLHDFKLIVVFDNMDRLPADKVKKLWSAIHSIFSTEDYPNIWCLIPYDFKHLSCAFGDNVNEREQLTKYFIDKSFPVVYRVPQPVIIDYKQIFCSFFKQAFADTVSDKDAEIINRCYRQALPEPNIRAIISFVNRMVTLTNVHGTNISPVSIAIYVLCEDDLLRHPVLKAHDKDKEVSTAEYILAEEYLKEFGKIVVDRSKLQMEIAALVYGIDPVRAYQLPMHNTLDMCFTQKDSQVDLNYYVKHPLFPSVLIETVHKADVSNHEQISVKLAEIIMTDMTTVATEAIHESWNYLADKYIEYKLPVSCYGTLEKNILSHVCESKQKDVAKVFCMLYTSAEEVKGDDLFNTLMELFNEPFAENWDIRDICMEISIPADQFVRYLQTAQGNYKLYPVSTGADELNKYLTEHLAADEDLTEVIKLIRLDDAYSVKDIADRALEVLVQEKASYIIATRMLHIAKLFYSRVNIKPSSEYLLNLWRKMKEAETDATKPSDEYLELYALLAVSHPGNLQSEPQQTRKEIAERALFYISTGRLLQLMLQYNSDSALKGIVLSAIVNCVADDAPELSGGFVSKWNSIRNIIPSVSVSHLFAFAEAWGYSKLSKEETAMSFEQLLPSLEWFNELLKTKTTLADALIDMSVSEVKSKSPDAFYNMQNLTPTNSYLYNRYVLLVNGDYIKNPMGENLEKIAIRALQLSASTGFTQSKGIDKLLDLGYEVYSDFASEITDIRRKIFQKADGYSVRPHNFVLLHRWLEKTGIDDEGNIRDAADTILYPIVEDAACQKIILENGDFYKPIIVKSFGISSDLHNRLKIISRADDDTEFKQYINRIIQYADDK